MRWSDAMKLSEYREWREYLDGFPGCYEIGVYWRGDFQPKYIGRATNVWKRIETYMDPLKCHNPYILMKIHALRHNLWFRVIRTERFHGLEARQQAYWGVSHDGLYEWNKRIEWNCLHL
jgi:hypothetical protein